jgi:hypothetical protein
MCKRTFVLSGVLCLSLVPGLVNAATVSITPPATTVAVGDVFNLSVAGSGFTTPMDAGGITITWNPAILELGPSGYTRAPGFIPPSGNGTAGPGEVADIFMFADPAKSGSFDFGVIQFHALASGTSDVVITESGINPFAGGGGALTVGFNNALVTVEGAGTVAPEPSTSLLLGGGLILTWFSRRRLLSSSRQEPSLQRIVVK